MSYSRDHFNSPKGKGSKPVFVENYFVIDDKGTKVASFRYLVSARKHLRFLSDELFGKKLKIAKLTKGRLVTLK